MGILEQYFLQLKTKKRRWRRAAAILTALSLVVAIGVSWNLRMTGITIANGATCGQEEHRHTDECPMEKVLICGYDEEAPAETPSEAPSEPAAETPADTIVNAAEDLLSGIIPAAQAADDLPEADPSVHIHSDACYEITWLCGFEEHYHILSCYSDATADIESSVIWEAGLPELTGQWADDLVLVAQSQVGCGESERNYLVEDDGVTRNGITRYGQWYGNPHGDWSAMFVLFCLNYAEIPQEAFPWSPGVYNMMRLAEDAGIFLEMDSNAYNFGNLLFLDTDQNENADKILIVTGFEEEKITTIGGDWANTVAEVSLLPDDIRILGYISMQQLQEAWEPEEAEPSEPVADSTDELTDEPTILLDLELSEDESLFRIIAHFSNIEAEQFTWQWQYSVDGSEPWIDIEGATELDCILENTEENFHRYYRIQGQKIPQQSQVSTFALIKRDTSVEEEAGTITSGAISPFSIDKGGSGSNTTYTIDVYALPVDSGGYRIAELPVVSLGEVTIKTDTKTAVTTWFNSTLGTYVSAYFGTESNATVNNVESVWRYRQSYSSYYLGYRANGRDTNRGYNSSQNNLSLYLRYQPKFTVQFTSEGFTTVKETVGYNQYLTVTEPGTWTRENHTLIGWISSNNQQNAYTFEEILQIPVKENVTYQAKWVQNLTINFNLGAYEQNLYPISAQVIVYGEGIAQLPTPIWRNNAVAMSFDGWYMDEGFTQPVTSSSVFYENTILYAKWSPTDEGYYVYFMDFQREGQTPLVLATYSVTEGRTASSYTPGNAPEGKEWDGKWYLDSNCTNAFNFQIPVSNMTEYLTGANNRDLYLYPGTQAVCRAIFVTYGTKVDPITVPMGGTIDLDQFTPEREGYVFAGWTLQDGTRVSGKQTLTKTTTYYASWNAGYVPFEAILRIENANDTGMTQASILGTWYAKAGSKIRVNSTYTGSGSSRKGTHTVVCVVNGEEFPVYTNEALTKQATLNDVYSTYFIYNNTGTNWTDEVNWDDVFTGGELPYSDRPISSAGDTIINFDYMRVRNDIVFTIPNNNNGGYIDVYKLQQNGLITGSVTYSGTKPTSTGQNVSAYGVSAGNISWSYTAASKVGDSYNNYYTLHNMKYGQRIFEVYPVGGSWLTARNQGYHQYRCGSGQLFSSRRQDLTSDFFSGSGRGLTPYSLTVEFENQEYIALMYAVECLEGETPDFTLNGIGYKVDTELCEVVKHTGDYSIKSLDGCEPGISANGTYTNKQTTYNKYYSAKITTNTTSATVMKNAKVGNTSVYTLFAETYWPYYSKFNGVESVTTFSRAYIFYYNRLHMNIQFNFGYDCNGDGSNDIITYPNIAYGERIGEYQFGMPDYEQHQYLERDGYIFAGWLDTNGFVLEEEDWESLIATGDSENNTMIFIAKWEKISNNIVEYYEDRSSAEPFESHYFDDGELVQYPTMTVYPEGWVWQEYGEGLYQRFDWDVPMYGEYGVQEVREVNGEEQIVNVIRIYGTWDESHTRVIYDPNAPQGGVIGTAPTDANEYTIWQSEVPVASHVGTLNSDPEMVFVGWKLDRNGIVYQSGDHVPVQWPRTMIFTAQWAKPEDVIYLRYDPNGGTPESIYPNEEGIPYKSNATALIWDNIVQDTPWFSRTGYTFTGWNTKADGTGTSYAPNSTIVLTEPVTTLYAQWEKDGYTLSITKLDSEYQTPLIGAEFGLYKKENGMFLTIQNLTTGVDGHITFLDLEIDTLYKLVEEKAPNGYAIIAKEIFFRIDPTKTPASLVFYDAEGNVIPAPNGVTGEYFTGSKIMSMTVQNLRGYELPATGGMGMPLYILCGLILTSAPLVYGLREKRRNERRSR